MPRANLFRRHGLLSVAAAGALLALIVFSLSFFVPKLLTAHYYQKSLGPLKRQAESVKKEIAALETALEARQRELSVASFPHERNQIFTLFQRLRINPEMEGVAYFDEDGALSVWLGNTIDFRPAAPDSSFLVHQKASFYLVSAQRIRETELVVFSRLLAFRPQPKAPYLKDYHFLQARLRTNGHIDYWDFREDVSGFEKIFGRHQDEYVSQPRPDNQIQTIFFPLRNRQGEIIATVNLGSPPLLSSVSRLRDTLIFLSALILALSLILLIIDLCRSYLFPTEKRVLSALALIIALAGLRLVFLPLSRLDQIQSLPLFSPSLAGFFSLGVLTQSAGDIFLTSLFFFLIIGSLAVLALRQFRDKKDRFPAAAAWVLNIAFLSIAFFSFRLFQSIVSRLVMNSNINLLRFAPDLSFLLLHLSLVFFFLSFFLVALSAFRSGHYLSPQPKDANTPVLIGLGILSLVFGNGRNPFLLVVQAGLLLFLFFLARRPASLKKREVVFTALFLGALLNTAQLHLDSTVRLRFLTQNFLQSTVVSQESWADFLLRQSLPEIEKRKSSILSFLKNPDETPFARSLWENTLVARFNWYSTLEVLDRDGGVLSRFSLNIPQLYQPEVELPPSQTWTISRLTVPSLGKEREFILAYKDWYLQNSYLGRMTFSMAVDPEMLPFLYSANPYFELLKVSSLPSLHQQEFGFATFDVRGKIIFNPQKISTGISFDVLQRVRERPDGLWTRFQDKGRTYESFLFLFQGRVYSFFVPRKNIIGLAVQFMKLLIFYLALASFVLLLSALTGRKRLAAIFWSFSSRVYAAFIAITVMALLLFSLFSQRFFTRLFVQRFTEKAEIHANLARNVMQDFVTLQQEEKATLIAPTDDLVLWISSAIANDVSLYREGRLVSSSRREFFDWGLLPELIDGEVYYRISNENRPFYIQRQKIGGISFQSLTIPYSISQSQFLISLPFPFEEQEIAGATQELVEFLIFVSVFFIVVILLFARGIGRMIISPVQKLLAGTRAVSLGNLEISIEHGSHDEMKTLVDGFNAMIKDLKKHQAEIADLSKKVAWAEMAQKVAHEIKNPLTPIQLSAEHILRVYEDKRGDFEKALKESASYIVSEVENLRRIAQEFLELSRVTSLKKEPFDLRDIVQEVISPYKKMLSERIRFREVYAGQEFPLEADRSKIKIAVRNIFVNAIEAIRGKGEIEIRLTAENDRLVLEIKDTGIGMARDVLERIFDPYFSTKDVGTGLGLPIAKKIIEDHGGSIKAESEVHRGTAVLITLPKKK